MGSLRTQYGVLPDCYSYGTLGVVTDLRQRSETILRLARKSGNFKQTRENFPRDAA